MKPAGWPLRLATCVYINEAQISWGLGQRPERVLSLLPFLDSALVVCVSASSRQGGNWCVLSIWVSSVLLSPGLAYNGGGS